MGCTSKANPADDAAPPAACADGEQLCDGNTLQRCAGGEFADTEVCADVCDPLLGCVLCQPGTGTCEGTNWHVCNEAGSGYDDLECDPVQGMSCDSASGRCTGVCSPANLGKSYLGCDYFPTVTGNSV